MHKDYEKRFRDFDIQIALSGEKPLQEQVQRDLDKAPEEWSPQDCQDWRDMGWRLPKNAGKNWRPK